MPNVQFKKGPSRRPAQSRKRSPTPPDADEPSSVVRTQTKSIANPLVQGTKRRRDVQAGDNVADDENGLDEFGYRADEGLTKRADELVTRANDWDLENEPVPEKKVRLNEDGDIDDGIYRGASNYLPTINKTRETLDKKMKSGPIKATSHVRTITLMDYQPDVCKDYKETGFCGYGDSCKFMHDRGDYLAGWQLDKMAEEGGGRAQVEEEDEDEEVPFACLICRKPFTVPVVTRCGHYFCMACATKRFQKSPKCYACGAATQGIFNTAEKIIAKIEARNKVRQEERDERKGQENDGGGIIFGGGDAASDASDDDE
ncbi:pre-mRNA-splicing factor CWC24 [Cryptococcus amylolentus CBS 6039]|uniref:Pre-mRNA-splicing factor CWC24 n=1 Tax=Cryptococcus amylolentus CBS 6039 TaxID=1295533 RepID=A0A1E3HYR2_9TREE|nr:pre-mRNA-splicing factor CWC24 [Cryptococcus amylolentus CBS 6039]ODN81474.1 pre-mRNA-splicing factor CWC24 [Cryptococcus amylolentus CBS 6039]